MPLLNVLALIAAILIIWLGVATVIAVLVGRAFSHRNPRRPRPSRREFTRAA
ncbi:MAG: hypothetical protein JWR33_1104 [Naasia sp.]|uniref:hypothetical protein n=1 Tax=Naasia sp. TaxID=2546198 RepID=UPI002626EE9A|nr:hypothetical protein [Naasia sp.]MCU1570363.1 hypothetical protein [Naasia sp.]